MTDDDLKEHLNLLHSDLHQLFEQSQKHDEQIAENARQIAENTRQIAENTRNIGRLATIAEMCLESTRRDGEHINALARIAELHHERLTRLES
jgi:methyl-accepting chemotaxis protein